MFNSSGNSNIFKRGLISSDSTGYSQDQNEVPNIQLVGQRQAILRKAASPPQKVVEPSPQREKNNAAEQERLMLETQMTFFVEEIEKVVQRDNLTYRSNASPPKEREQTIFSS